MHKPLYIVYFYTLLTCYQIQDRYAPFDDKTIMSKSKRYVKKNIQKKILNKYSFFDKSKFILQNKKKSEEKIFRRGYYRQRLATTKGVPRILSFFFTFFVSLHYIN